MEKKGFKVVLLPHDDPDHGGKAKGGREKSKPTALATEYSSPREGA